IAERSAQAGEDCPEGRVAAVLERRRHEDGRSDEADADTDKFARTRLFSTGPKVGHDGGHHWGERVDDRSHAACEVSLSGWEERERNGISDDAKQRELRP